MQSVFYSDHPSLNTTVVLLSETYLHIFSGWLRQKINVNKWVSGDLYEVFLFLSNAEGCVVIAFA